MKNFYSAVIALILVSIQFSPAVADTTYVAGNVSGVWDIEGSPYITTSAINVPDGLTLTIEPCVSIVLNDSLIVYGGLNASGTSEDSIFINVPWGFYGAKIFYIDSNDSVLFRYCSIFSTGAESGFQLQGGDIIIDNCCLIMSNGNWAIYSAIEIACDGVIISNNTIKVFGGGALDFSTGGIVGYGETVSILNNEIYVEAHGHPSHTVTMWVVGIYNLTGIIAYNEIKVLAQGWNNYTNYGFSVGIEYFDGEIVGNRIEVLQYALSWSSVSAECIKECSGLIQRNVLIANQPDDGHAQCIGDANGIIQNNTLIIDCIDGIGIDDCEGGFVNNIIYRIGGIHTIGINCEIDHSYNCISNCDTAYGVGVEPGIGDIYENPRFVDSHNGDYHLSSESPCIDAGDPNSPLDPDSTRADMGAFYYHQTSGIGEEETRIEFPDNFTFEQPYPNPFNPQTTIRFELREADFVSLCVFDVQGREVACLKYGHLSAGKHEFTFDGSDLSSGIYFVILKASDFMHTEKLLLIK